ncbi:MAG: LrgB family protein [Rhodospirillales bacterium]|nr:LrgB family protein [Rhodospirillales bacterium]
MGDVFRLWVYLSASPLLWLTVTLGAYVLAETIAQALRHAPLANPVLVAVVLVAITLRLTHTGYATYFAGAQFVHFLLGPATVALAVPLVREAAEVRRLALPILAALLAGSATAIATAMGLAWALGASPEVIVSLAPKSVTTPIAMGIAAANGGLPALTAVFVLITGVVGGISVTPVMNLIGVREYPARGFAAGLASHGIGTARAFQVDRVAGTFAGLALALNALATSLLVPALLALLAWAR